jgi:tRNA(Arg) A34 adenosine deaminase TadA
MRLKLLPACLTVLPALLSAQTVRGVVVDQLDRPLPGVVIQLADSTSRVHVRALTGDRGECSDVPETSAAWAQATSTRENCLGSSCRHYQDCFVMKARKRAAEADVIVVNHHLFFADVVLRDEGAQDLLPSANTIVFDEAHHLPDLARLFFGKQVSTSQALELARDARIVEAQHARESSDIGDAALDVEKGARDLRLALGNAMGRTALASLRGRAAFDAALDALAASLAARAAKLRAQEERADEIRNCRMRCDALAAVIGDWRLSECELYVTKEPCAMCAGAIVHTRVKRVIFGCLAPKDGAAGSLMNLLQHPKLNHRCELTSGVRQDECVAMLQAFFRERRGEGL